MVEPGQFSALALPKLQQWLAQGMKSKLFVSVMYKIQKWEVEQGEGLVVSGVSD